MTTMYPNELQYKATASWDGKTGGKVSTGTHIIEFDTPKTFKGTGKHPCPDQLFLASVSGCLMNTFLSFKNRFGADTMDIQIETDSILSLQNSDGYRITQLNAVIKIKSSPEFKEINRRCGELARDYCHLTRSIEDSIPINVEVRVSVVE